MIKHQMGICVCGQMKRVKFKTDQRKQIIGYDGGSVEYVRRWVHVVNHHLALITEFEFELYFSTKLNIIVVQTRQPDADWFRKHF